MALLRASSVASITALAIAIGCATHSTSDAPPAVKQAHPLGVGGGPLSANAIPRTIRWDETLSELGPDIGDRLAFICPKGGTLEGTRVMGSDVYSDDSAICAAAVHAGKITVQAGGMVTLEVTGKKPHYDGSLRNGVDSTSSPGRDKGFVFR